MLEEGIRSQINDGFRREMTNQMTPEEELWKLIHDEEFQKEDRQRRENLIEEYLDTLGMNENIYEEVKKMTGKCKKCNEEIFESGSISRCLKCGKATPNEISGKEYYEEKINK